VNIGFLGDGWHLLSDKSPFESIAFHSSIIIGLSQWSELNYNSCVCSITKRKPLSTCFWWCHFKWQGTTIEQCSVQIQSQYVFSLLSSYLTYFDQFLGLGIQPTS
jgi:hypothetical protein